MSSLSLTRNRPKVQPRIQADPDAAMVHEGESTAVAGARLLAEALSLSASPTSQKPHPRRKISETTVSFSQAYAVIGQSVPKGDRLRVLREMVEALEQTIRAEEQAARPVAVSASGEAQQENDHFMAELRDQARMQRTKDIASKKLLTSAEMANRLGLTKQALSAAVRAQRMFVLAGPSGESFFPAFFADARYDRPILAKVSKALGGLSGGCKWEFFTSPRISLQGKSPLEALAKGHIESVLDAATAFREE